MRLAFTEEQEELRASVRRLLQDRLSGGLVAAAESPDPYDAALWKLMAEELGLHGMAIPEEYGGSGFGFVEQAVVLEEMGRFVLRSPYLSTVIVAANALLLGDSEDLRRAWLPRIAAGEVVATLAHVEPGGDWTAAAPAVTAVADGDRLRVTGVKGFVVDGAEAGLFIVYAKGPGGEPVLAAVEAGQGVTAKAEPVFDATRRLATVTFEGAAADVIATGDRAREVLARTLEYAAVGLACEQTGGAARALEMAVDYAKIREQFGVPIGSFQAVKFKCADMLLQVEAARSAAYYAAASLAAGDEETPVCAAVAKSVCSDAYMFVAAESIQVHGGIGYTWEHEAHLYFKRAKASQVLFGDPDLHRERLATLVGV